MRPSSLEERTDAREQVLSAARRCFLRTGVRKTTMEDVAAAAGTTRQLVYKLFFGRKELVQAAIVSRFVEIAGRIPVDEWTDGSLEEAFTRGSLTVIEAIRDDHELSVLFGEGSPLALHEVVWLDSVARGALRFWAPWLARARAEGLLRDDISDEDIAGWLQTVYPSLILRQGMDRDEERRMIERFVLTSLAMVRRPT
jgi:AcrR family transcriptional regulator